MEDTPLKNNEPSVDDNQTQANNSLKNAQVEELKDQLKLITADFHNYQKRTERDRLGWTDSAYSTILNDLVAVVINMDRAINSYQTQSTQEAANVATGFGMIQKELHKFLEKYHVTPITQYQTFDPELHEALVQVESPDHRSGSIVQILEPGFMFKQKILRPAKVTVAK